MGDEFDEMDLNESYVCAAWAPILGFTGITAAVVFASELLHVSSPTRDPLRRLLFTGSSPSPSTSLDESLVGRLALFCCRRLALVYFVVLTCNFLFVRLDSCTHQILEVLMEQQKQV